MVLVGLQGCKSEPQVQRSESRAASTRAAASAMPAPTPSSSAMEAVASASPEQRPPTLGRVAKRVGRAAVDDTNDGTQWAKTCNIWRPCPPVAPLKPCAPGLEAIDATSFVGTTAKAAVGQELAVRGRLGLFSSEQTAVHCDKKLRCCNRSNSNVFLGEPPRGLYLPMHPCGGDESRRCCPVPAFGQEVIAVGKLSLDDNVDGAAWRLTDTSLCIEKK